MKAIISWRNQKQNNQNLNQGGVIVSKTKIIEAPKGFRGPYWVVLVALSKDKRVVGQWADINEPKIGMKVVGVVRKITEPAKADVIEYGVKWKQA
jgi:uncharacterized OB-fold protein